MVRLTAVHIFQVSFQWVNGHGGRMVSDKLVLGRFEWTIRADIFLARSTVSSKVLCE
jgi:hypothetical protein